VATGARAGQAARRWALPPADGSDAPTTGVSHGGYGLHAGTWVAAERREQLERLCRYVLRSPIAKGRLEERGDGQLVWHLRRPWRDGTRAFVYSPLELTERLAALVVRPRVHTIHYHGVFAPHAAWRARVVDPAEVARRRAQADADRAETTLRKRHRRNRRRRLFAAHCPWSELLERVFGEGGFRCPKCHGVLSLRAIVLDPTSAQRILASLAHSARAGPTGPLWT
jgi:hypothetical protein